MILVVISITILIVIYGLDTNLLTWRKKKGAWKEDQIFNNALEYFATEK